MNDDSFVVRLLVVELGLTDEVFIVPLRPYHRSKQHHMQVVPFGTDGLIEPYTGGGEQHVSAQKRKNHQPGPCRPARRYFRRRAWPQRILRQIRPSLPRASTHGLD